jgi:hypothetical protein
MSCFLFYLFTSTKSENRRVEQILSSREAWHQWRGKIRGKGDKRVNIVQKSAHMSVNAKMIPVEATIGMGGGEIRRTTEG